jgi:GTPase
MNFIDRVTVLLEAGKGGDGIVSFRREKFVDKGGPDGGDGGKGGNIIFVASRNENTLANFRFKKELKAADGQAGSKRNKHGRSAKDLFVTVPVGTAVTDESGTLLADLTVDGQSEVVAKGGFGGYGNAHFVSSVRQVPQVAELGEPGQRLHVSMELKLIADVGLVGLPNAGKSTLLSVISNARPEIGDYAFTTITPNLGVVNLDEHTSALFADIPGLIEGAAEGKGLGDEFLRHVERTLVLVHVIDAYQNDVVEAYKTIQAELKAYKINLSDRPQVIALNKTEGLDEEMVDDLVAQLRGVAPDTTPLHVISAQAHKNLKPLLFSIKDVLLEQKRTQVAAETPDDAMLQVLSLETTDDGWRVEKTPKGFVVSGTKIERFAVRTNFGSSHGVERLRDIMRRTGIMHELIRQGIESGDKIIIGSVAELTY